MPRMNAASCLLIALVSASAVMQGAEPVQLAGGIEAATKAAEKPSCAAFAHSDRTAIEQVAVGAAQEPAASPAQANPNPGQQDPGPEKPAQDRSAAPSGVAVPPPAAGTDKPIDPQMIEQAKAGDILAQYRLGYAYFLGRGVSQDYIQAAIWWKKSAEQGYPEAQNNLGVLYNTGKGVPQSYSEAYFWQNLAAARASGSLQAEFTKNRDESGAKLWVLERLRIQNRATKWAKEHPIPPSITESKADHP